MKLNNNYLTTLPTEFKSLTKVVPIIDLNCAKNNYLNCDELQAYVPSSYCGTQYSLSTIQSFLQSFHKSLFSQNAHRAAMLLCAIILFLLAKSFVAMEWPVMAITALACNRTP